MGSISISDSDICTAIQRISRGEELSTKRCNKVYFFIKSIIGSDAVNTRLEQLSQQHPDLDARTVGQLRAFTHKTKGLSEQYRTSKAARYALEAYLENGTIPQQRLTRRQVRQLESAARLYPFMKHLKSLGLLFRKGTRLSKVYTMALRAHRWHDTMLQKLEKRGRNRSGDVIAHTFDNDIRYHGRNRPAIMQWYYRNVMHGHYTHLGIALRQNKENHISHMWGNPDSVHTVARRTIGSYGAEVFRLRFDNAIPDQGMRDRIQEHYGKPWKQVVKKMYSECLHDWHQQNQLFLGRLSNPPSKRLLVAGMYNSYSLFPQPWRERMQFEDGCFKAGTEVTCGEFTLKAQLHALDLLGRRLALDLGTGDLGESIVQPPIDPYRRLQRFSPSNIVKRAESLGGLRRVAPPAIFTDLIE